jgi:hypothetical protein
MLVRNTDTHISNKKTNIITKQSFYIPLTSAEL